LADDVGAASSGAISGLLYLGIVPTALAFSTWAYALARTSAGSLGISTYLVPPLTIVIAWVLLGEVPALLALAGGVVCLGGVALSRRRDRSLVVEPGPTSSSWLNLVERWFRELTDKALRRGVFHSVPDLITAIQAYLDAHNDEPKPFVWTATAEDILAKVARGRVALQAVTQN
jgi:hypothetical protein